MIYLMVQIFKKLIKRKQRETQTTSPVKTSALNIQKYKSVAVIVEKPDKEGPPKGDSEERAVLNTGSTVTETTTITVDLENTAAMDENTTPCILDKNRLGGLQYLT